MDILPERLYCYFWDTKAADLDIRKYASSVISRLLLFAVSNPDLIEWLAATYDKSLILDVFNTSRQLQPNELFFPLEHRQKLEKLLSEKL